METKNAIFPLTPYRVLRFQSRFLVISQYHSTMVAIQRTEPNSAPMFFKIPIGFPKLAWISGDHSP